MAERPSAVISRVAASVGGRGPSVGPIEARFGLPIISARQIGFQTSPRPGLESVKLIKIPSTQFPESRQARSVIRQPQPRGEIIFFPRARPVETRPVPERASRPIQKAIPTPIEYQRLVNRVRVVQRSLRQTRIVSNPEVSSAPSSQIQTSPEPAVRTYTQPTVETLNKIKPEAERPIANRVRTRNGLSIVINRTNAEVYKSRKYKGKDQQTNSKRLQVLDKEYEAIKSENPSVEVDGTVLARRSFIGTLESLKSAIFYQRGELNREDGSQKRIELMLSSVRAIDKGKLRDIIGAKTAIKETDQAPPEPLTNEQVSEVFNPPNKPLAHSEPVVTEKLTGNQQEVNSVKTAVLMSSNQPVEKTENRKEEMEERIEGKTQAGLILSSPLDTEVDNIIIGIKEREGLFKTTA